MKVRIIEKKRVAEELTIEMTAKELSKKHYVGVSWAGDKYMFVYVGSGFAIVRPTYWIGGKPIDGLELVEKALGYEGLQFHVFDDGEDPRKELYLWMAE